MRLFLFGWLLLLDVGLSMRAQPAVLRSGTLYELREASRAAREAADDRDWVLIGRRDGVTVWKRVRVMSNTTVSSFAVKAVVNVNVAADQLAALLLTRDYTVIRKFNPTILDGRDLEWRHGRRERVTYVQTKPIWPLHPRDFVCRVRHVTLPGGIELIQNEPAIHRLEAPRRAYIRGRLRGVHMIAPTGARSCRYTSIHEIDPAGNVPRALVNWFACRKPHAYCTQLRSLAQSIQEQSSAPPPSAEPSYRRRP